MIDYRAEIKRLSGINFQSPDMQTLDDILIKLSVALSEIGDRKASARFGFNRKFRECKIGADSARGAEIEANASDEFKEMDAAEIEWEYVKKIIDSVKHIQNQMNELYRRGI